MVPYSRALGCLVLLALACVALSSRPAFIHGKLPTTLRRRGRALSLNPKALVSISKEAWKTSRKKTWQDLMEQLANPFIDPLTKARIAAELIGMREDVAKSVAKVLRSEAAMDEELLGPRTKKQIKATLAFQRQLVDDIIPNALRHNSNSAKGLQELQTLLSHTIGNATVHDLPSTASKVAKGVQVFFSADSDTAAPEYEVENGTAEYEIRTYSPMTLVSLKDSSANRSQQQTYDVLAGLISGMFNEQAKTNTMPFLTENDGNAEKMSFIIPKAAVKHMLVPTDSIVVTKKNSARIAVRHFTGYATQQEVELQKKTLIDALEKDGVQLPANLRFAIIQYNSLFTLPTVRRNEILIELDASASAPQPTNDTVSPPVVPRVSGSQKYFLNSKAKSSIMPTKGPMNTGSASQKITVDVAEMHVSFVNTKKRDIVAEIGEKAKEEAVLVAEARMRRNAERAAALKQSEEKRLSERIAAFKKANEENFAVEEDHNNAQRSAEEERLAVLATRLEQERTALERERVSFTAVRRAQEQRLVAEAKQADEAAQKKAQEAHMAAEAKIKAEELRIKAFRQAQEAHLAAEAKRLEQLRDAIEAMKQAEEERLGSEAKKLDEQRVAVQEKLEKDRLALEAILSKEEQRIRGLRQSEQERAQVQSKKRVLQEIRVTESKKKQEELRLAAEAQKLEEDRYALENTRRTEEERLVAQAQKLEEERLALEAMKIAEEQRLLAWKADEDARLKAEVEKIEERHALALVKAEEEKRAAKFKQAEEGRIRALRKEEQQRLEAISKKLDDERRALDAAKKTEMERIAAEAQKLKERLEMEAKKLAEDRAALEAMRKAEKERISTMANQLMDDARSLQRMKQDEEDRLAAEFLRLEESRMKLEAFQVAEEERFSLQAKTLEEQRSAAQKQAEEDRLALDAKAKAEEEKILSLRKSEQERAASVSKKRAEEEEHALEASRKAELERIAAEVKHLEEDRKAFEATKKLEEERLAMEAKQLAEDRLALEGIRKEGEGRLVAEEQRINAMANQLADDALTLQELRKSEEVLLLSLRSDEERIAAQAEELSDGFLSLAIKKAAEDARISELKMAFFVQEERLAGETKRLENERIFLEETRLSILENFNTTQERLLHEAREIEQERIVLAETHAYFASEARLAQEAVQKAHEEEQRISALRKEQEERLVAETNRLEASRLDFQAYKTEEEKRLSLQATKLEQQRIAAEAKAEEDRLALEAKAKEEEKRILALRKSEQQRAASASMQAAEREREALEATRKAELERIGAEAKQLEADRRALEETKKLQEERLAVEAKQLAEDRAALEGMRKAEEGRLQDLRIAEEQRIHAMANQLADDALTLQELRKSEEGRLQDLRVAEEQRINAMANQLADDCAAFDEMKKTEEARLLLWKKGEEERMVAEAKNLEQLRFFAEQRANEERVANEEKAPAERFMFLEQRPSYLDSIAKRPDSTLERLPNAKDISHGIAHFKAPVRTSNYIPKVHVTPKVNRDVAAKDIASTTAKGHGNPTPNFVPKVHVTPKVTPKLNSIDVTAKVNGEASANFIPKVSVTPKTAPKGRIYAVQSQERSDNDTHMPTHPVSNHAGSYLDSIASKPPSTLDAFTANYKATGTVTAKREGVIGDVQDTPAAATATGQKTSNYIPKVHVTKKVNRDVAAKDIASTTAKGHGNPTPNFVPKVHVTPKVTPKLNSIDVTAKVNGEASANFIPKVSVTPKTAPKGRIYAVQSQERSDNDTHMPTHPVSNHAGSYLDSIASKPPSTLDAFTANYKATGTVTAKREGVIGDMQGTQVTATFTPANHEEVDESKVGIAHGIEHFKAPGTTMLQRTDSEVKETTMAATPQAPAAPTAGGSYLDNIASKVSSTLDAFIANYKATGTVTAKRESVIGVVQDTKVTATPQAPAAPTAGGSYLDNIASKVFSTLDSFIANYKATGTVTAKRESVIDDMQGTQVTATAMPDNNEDGDQSKLGIAHGIANFMAPGTAKAEQLRSIDINEADEAQSLKGDDMASPMVIKASAEGADDTTPVQGESDSDGQTRQGESQDSGPNTMQSQAAAGDPFSKGFKYAYPGTEESAQGSVCPSSDYKDSLTFQSLSKKPLCDSGPKIEKSNGYLDNLNKKPTSTLEIFIENFKATGTVTATRGAVGSRSNATRTLRLNDNSVQKDSKNGNQEAFIAGQAEGEIARGIQNFKVPETVVAKQQNANFDEEQTITAATPQDMRGSMVGNSYLDSIASKPPSTLDIFTANYKATGTVTAKRESVVSDVQDTAVTATFTPANDEEVDKSNVGIAHGIEHFKAPGTTMLQRTDSEVKETTMAATPQAPAAPTAGGSYLDNIASKVSSTLDAFIANYKATGTVTAKRESVIGVVQDTPETATPQAPAAPTAGGSYLDNIASKPPSTLDIFTANYKATGTVTAKRESVVSDVQDTAVTATFTPANDEEVDKSNVGIEHGIEHFKAPGTTMLQRTDSEVKETTMAATPQAPAAPTAGGSYLDNIASKVSSTLDAFIANYKATGTVTAKRESVIDDMEGTQVTALNGREHMPQVDQSAAEVNNKRDIAARAATPNPPISLSARRDGKEMLQMYIKNLKTSGNLQGKQGEDGRHGGK